MKLGLSKDTLEAALYSLPVGLTMGFLNKRLTLVNVLAALGIGLLANAFGCNLLVSNVLLALTLIVLTYYKPEGFNTTTPPTEISATLKKLKEGFEDGKEEEEEGFEDEEEKEEKEEKEGFMNKVFQNITTAGYTSSGSGMGGPLVEGFEDQKSEKKSKPAPVEKKELAAPFKLGEIPSQVKNGPHIDAGSTLMKAIQGLNPEQINAMTKDTQQLIETQKSLMGMLGTMKPMMQDGKELMDTFQQMFGN
jgi:hypothetical protein